MRCDLAADDDVIALVRATVGDSLVVVIQPGRSALALAQTCAAIGPLAVEQAPGRRINAVLVGADSDPTAVAATARFLESAASTTGQIVAIS
ncbi:Rossmann fold domain-containing protein [Sphingomonas oligophenolica]|uniref:Short chain dehydrogenase-like proteobacteria domain-containing protein n=1 Tax=Sphingomonas oligophenolica TaxID=301154 RepID=A0A502CP22_9SPHN|nr:hypothetical protein [Sphingomonas oligophenolica]TPG14492.1 hypothetical protein EAH84_04125 [Sphingomonas oligophenolica]